MYSFFSKQNSRKMYHKFSERFDMIISLFINSFYNFYVNVERIFFIGNLSSSSLVD